MIMFKDVTYIHEAISKLINGRSLFVDMGGSITVLSLPYYTVINLLLSIIALN